MTIGRAIYWTLGGVQKVVEFLGAAERFAHRLRKRALPLPDDTEPIPLSRLRPLPRPPRPPRP